MAGALYRKDQEFSFGHAEFYIDVEQVVGWMMNVEMEFKISRLDEIPKCGQRRDILSFGSL